MAGKVTLNGELMFPNDYVSAQELGGKDVNLTISAVSKEMLQKKSGQSKAEMVIRFEKTTKKLVCNKTNSNSIAAATKETEASKWVGKRITVYPTRCLAFGEMVDCIRVRETAPTGKPKADEPPPPSGADDAKDFIDSLEESTMPDLRPTSKPGQFARPAKAGEVKDTL